MHSGYTCWAILSLAQSIRPSICHTAAGEDDEGTAILSGIVRDKEQFDLLVAVVRTLVATDQPRDAREVIGGIMKLISSCAFCRSAMLGRRA